MGYWSVERQRGGRKVWLIALCASVGLILVLALVLIPIRSSMAGVMKAEAARAIQLHPDLAAEIGGNPRFGFTWRMYERSDAGGARAVAYVPVTGSRSSGTLYLEDWNGKLRTVRYRAKGRQDWQDF